MRRTIDRLQAARREDRGFTLIELLIVIIILGILAAIVVFSVRGITDRGEESACKTSVRTVDTAYEAYIADGGTGATTAVTLGDLDPDFLHGIPDNVGSLTTTAATTVAAVDGVAC